MIGLISAATIALATYRVIEPPGGEFYGNAGRRSLILVLPYLAAYGLAAVLLVLATEYAVRRLNSRFANRDAKPS